MPRALGALCLLGLVVLAGCGFGGNDGARKPEAAITRAQLALMVLPREELGRPAKGLRPGEDSGRTSNAQAAEDSLDPEDTAVSLRGAGRIAGYGLSYENPRLLAADRPRGTFFVGTEVELMRDSVYAAQYLNRKLDDFHRFEGRADDGVRVRGVSNFAVDGVGDEADGLRATVTFAGIRTYMTVVAFRTGRLVGHVSLVRADRRESREEATQLAVALDERIQEVLAGRITGKPEPLAPKTAQKASLEGREKLPSLTLAREDLPAGGRPAGQGRRKRESYVSYHRTFEDVRLGGSHLRSLRAETQLYRTPTDAALAYRVLGTPDGRRIFARALVDGLAERTALEPWNVRVRAFPGRDLPGVVVGYETPEGRFEVATVFLRKGRVIAGITGFCTAYALDPADLRPLAQKARARLGEAV